MSLFRNVTTTPNYSTIGYDAGGRQRVSELTTLFGGKIINEDNIYLFDNVGTGTGLYANNKYNMSVTAGQYRIRQSRTFQPYFEGKSQFIECTFDNFQTEANVSKRVGYFSSSTVSPYNTNYDGFWLENDGTTIRLRAARNGTDTVDVPITSFDNYSSISGYNWSNFTVIAFDFLWLGGTAIRLFLKTNNGFELIHTFNYAGNYTDTIILSPNQPIRYEIRSTTGTGSLRYICSQVATEGSSAESGMNGTVDSLLTNAIPSNTVATTGTIYPLKAIRLKSTHRSSVVKLTHISVFSNTNDQSRWELHLNPTLASALTYTDVDNSPIQEANGSAVAAITNTVTASGRKLDSGYFSQNSVIPITFDLDYLSRLGSKIDGTRDELVLCVVPISGTSNVNGSIKYKQY